MRRPLLTRIERLEAGCQQNDAFAADRCRIIRQAALGHLSLDQKKSLLACLNSYRQGHPLTSEEAAAAVEIFKAFESAVTVECQKAGIKLADYRRCCGRDSKTPGAGSRPVGRYRITAPAAGAAENKEQGHDRIT
jgi:hypothetical protein